MFYSFGSYTTFYEYFEICKGAARWWKEKLGDAVTTQSTGNGDSYRGHGYPACTKLGF